ncbi:hypothetical protein [Salinisphaera orenii]|uniref:hypothetical protein n=1 Tax=Salinisphaera orenii TaxID=856731 RepID=UPI000DBE82F7
MDADGILAKVRHYGADVRVEHGELALYAGERLPVDIKGELRAHKAEVTQRVAANDEPLAAKLRWLGCPIALEVDGEVVTWVVADDETATDYGTLNPLVTASEAEVLAGLDTGGIRRLLRMKARLGGRIEPAEADRME